MKLIFLFFVGFSIGCFVILSPFMFTTSNKKWKIAIKSQDPTNLFRSQQSENLFDDSLAQKLFNEVRILCLVLTYPAHHKSRGAHVQNTWGKRCNKLIFITSKDDGVFEDSLVLNITESRNVLWNKTKNAFFYAHDVFIDDYDFFLKADDDNYIIVENLRYMLYQYNPDLSYYFGHRYKVPELEEGYMAGGGYILSRQAVKNFVHVAETNPKQCLIKGTVEDWEMGRCLTHNAVFLMDHDEKNQKRFFPLSIDEHLVPKHKVNPSWWYRQRMYFEVEQGDLNCCSETAIAFHYINPHLMYMLEYFIYYVHPFGVVETPDKLSGEISSNNIDETQ